MGFNYRTWGQSWGDSWGDSWGVGGAVVTPPPQGGGPFPFVDYSLPGARRRRQDEDERCRRIAAGILKELKPSEKQKNLVKEVVLDRLEEIPDICSLDAEAVISRLAKVFALDMKRARKEKISFRKAVEERDDDEFAAVLLLM